MHQSYQAKRSTTMPALARQEAVLQSVAMRRIQEVAPTYFPKQSLAKGAKS
jgi:hypothetical protein